MKPIRNRYFVFTDVILLSMAAYASYVLRLESFDLTGRWWGLALFTVLALVFILFFFWRAGIYSRYWRYASIEELLLLAGCVVVGAALAGAVGLLISRYGPLPHKTLRLLVIPRSVPLIFMLLAVPAAAIPRFAVRATARYGHRRPANGRTRPVLVVGAGDAGALMVRELHHNPQLGMDVVGFVDDDSSKHQTRIHGVPVLGDRSDIPHLVSKHKVKQVVIAMPRASGKTIREIVAICEQAGTQTQIVPGVYEILGGDVSVNQLRSVQIEDLLRRAPVQTDVQAVGELISGKRVLVTGGGGSIGSELCRQILRFGPASLVVLGHGENSVFEAQNELLDAARQVNVMAPDGTETDATPTVDAVIADIRHPDRLRALFHEHRPQIVFHAAAHKHVPLMELNPGEAITNNVVGTRNLLDIVLDMDIRHFVMISTDKAVNPTSVMGASKRVAELLVHRAAKQSGNPYVAVRFGNVLGSRGSVVPVFKKQIEMGGPVTITSPDMKRFFMTIPEAVQLVLQSATLGTGGEVFVLDMGEPVRIVDLAEDLIRLSGLELGQDIDIVFTGVRPGEKMYEELFVSGEDYHRTCHEKIMIAGNASIFVPPDLDKSIQSLEQAADEGDRAAILDGLKELVPEFEPMSGIASSDG